MYRSHQNITIVKLPEDVGFITLRPESGSGGPAIDISNVPGVTFRRIHFKEAGH